MTPTPSPAAVHPSYPTRKVWHSFLSLFSPQFTPIELRKRSSSWPHGVLSDLSSFEFKMEDALVISMTVQCDCSSIKISKPFLLEFIFYPYIRLFSLICLCRGCPLPSSHPKYGTYFSYICSHVTVISLLRGGGCQGEKTSEKSEEREK